MHKPKTELLKFPKGRKEWPKLYKLNKVELSIFMGYILMLFYCKRKIRNLLHVAKVTHVTYAHIFRQVGGLISIGYITRRKEGRTNTYNLTKKGIEYCNRLLISLK